MLNAGPRDGLRERCYRFVLNVIGLTNDLPNKRSAWVITDQLIRPATSIGANITEAKGSGSRLEYKRFFQIALKSANETQYWLQLLKDSELNNGEKTNVLLDEIEQICRMLASSVIKLKQK